jgi:hypothetical protein
VASLLEEDEVLETGEGESGGFVVAVCELGMFGEEGVVSVELFEQEGEVFDQVGLH